ncbi:putative MFS family arabinose efflux permease [Arthrobacter globiformis]|nr:putative MFS family arabinose efflux permease [Arthrobacter globiformis]
MAGFVALQATNSASISIMSLFVTERLNLPLIWSGIALGLSALLEIPALVAIGKLSKRYSAHTLIVSGCLAGAMYYTVMTFLADPITLLVAQMLNAWFFGIVAGVGLTIFQDIIPRPGLASGLYTNTRRIGAIVSGALIALGSATPLGYQGIFAACAIITLAALALMNATRTRTDQKS